MLKDLRHAVRMLLHAKGWTAVVILSLALGIGANTAIFSAVNGLLLTEVPVKDPKGLVRLRSVGRNDMRTSSSDYGFIAPEPDGAPVRATFSYPMYQQFLADNQTMSDLIACAPIGRVNVVVDGRAEIATAFVASGNYHQALGVRARLGRTILPADDSPSAPPVAVISSKFWNARFGADPGAVGKTMSVNGVPLTVVGVIEPAFIGIQQPLGEPPDVSLPLVLDTPLNPGPATATPRLGQATFWWLQVIGRLKPGV
ncbi:MAG TPA: ABC transporter permease, partial [Vicinamibacterales bacterium]|nr:ABC transporter permease [Vicinamibacterales bacterium]